MKALLFCVFGICTLTLNAADLTPQQLAAADKVAHAYVEAWLAGDYDKAIVLADVSHAISTSGRVAAQATKYTEITEVLEWGKPEVCETEFVAIKFVSNTREYKKSTAEKKVWWLGLVEVGGNWKVCYINPFEANRPKSLAAYVKRKAAVREDALPSFERNMKTFKKTIDDYHTKEATAK